MKSLLLYVIHRKAFFFCIILYCWVAVEAFTSSSRYFSSTSFSTIKTTTTRRTIVQKQQPPPSQVHPCQLHLNHPQQQQLLNLDSFQKTKSTQISATDNPKEYDVKQNHWTRTLMSRTMTMALCTLFTVQQLSMAAHATTAAAAATATEHLHTGQKVANFFRSFGIPDLGVLAIISALPVVELRGAVPVGIWMGLPITTVLPICVLGNMIPIVPLLFLLRNDRLKNLMKPILDRAEKKASGLGVGSLKKQWASLAAFVGIPLPGTGAWTGAMGAFLLGMPTAIALSSIFTGVVSAGIIMSAITLTGKKGGIVALIALFALTGKQFVSSD